MKYVNVSDSSKRVVKNRVKTLVKPREIINLETADINHSSSALRFFEPYVEDKEVPVSEERTNEQAEDQAPAEDQTLTGYQPTKDQAHDGGQEQGEDLAKEPSDQNGDVTETPAEEEKTDGEIEVPKNEVVPDSKRTGEQAGVENTEESTGESEEEQKVETANNEE